MPGEWERMFQDHPQAVARPVPFGIDKAQMLMVISRHPLLSKADHGRCLPSSWRTLYELTKVPEPVLRKALTDGTIHPALEAAVGDALGPAEHGHDRKKGAKSITTDLAKTDRLHFRLLAQHRRGWEAECEQRRFVLWLDCLEPGRIAKSIGRDDQTVTEVDREKADRSGI